MLYFLILFGIMVPNMPDTPFVKWSSGETYNYEIGLDIVTDPVSAKEATDYIRYTFAQFPVFNDSLDEFRFKSNVFVSDVEFYDLSLDNGYIVTKFVREAK